MRAGFLPRVFRVHVPHLNPAVARSTRPGVHDVSRDSGGGHVRPAAGCQYPLDAVEDPTEPANRRVDVETLFGSCVRERTIAVGERIGLDVVEEGIHESE